MARKKTGKRSNNEGSVVKQPNGRYRAQVSLGYKEDGTRNRISDTFDTLAEANMWRIQKLALAQQYGNESAKEIEGMFIPNFHQWLLEKKKGKVQPVQFKVMMSQYNKHIKPFFLKFKQKDIEKKDFQKFFKQMEIKAVGIETRKKIYQLLRQYFEYVYDGTMMRNPLDNIEYAPKKAEEIITLENLVSNEDYKAIPKNLREQFFTALDKEKSSPFLKPFCYLMFFAGNRVGEVIPLQWKDFDLNRRFYYVYKGVARHYEFDENGETIGKGTFVIKGTKSKTGIRPLPLIDIVYEAISEWYDYRKAQEKVLMISFTAPNDFVFANNKGQMRSEDGTEKIFQRFLKRNGLAHQGIHFHSLRQSLSNTLFATETDETVITDIMGHANISTTKKHYKSLEKFDSVQKAAKMLNELYKPKNEKYCATEEVTFAPDGYVSEIESTKNFNRQVPKSSLTQTKSLNELFTELSSYPEFKELIEKIKSSENVSE